MNANNQVEYVSLTDNFIGNSIYLPGVRNISQQEYFNAMNSQEAPNSLI